MLSSRKCLALCSDIHLGASAKISFKSELHLYRCSNRSANLLCSLDSLFCRTRSSIQPVIMSDGTRSVFRNRELKRVAICENASCECSSRMIQQKNHRKRRTQMRVILRAVNVSTVTGAPSAGAVTVAGTPFLLVLTEPIGSSTMANPNMVKQSMTQLKQTRNSTTVIV
uniref:Uncharacterized protein n=2 Tax=Cacopsylla melanoneura TaxID=428564 RepID=A0A8D8TVQ6_9HEMI